MHARIVLVLVTALFVSGPYAVHAAAEDTDPSRARVQRVLGKEVYALSEPVRDYEVIERVNTVGEQLFGIAGGLADVFSFFGNKALRKEKKGQEVADAIISQDGTTAILVKFVDEPTSEEGVARVHRSLGKYVFFLCEPETDYEVVTQLTSAATVLGVGADIGLVAQGLARKAGKKEKKFGQIDAVLSSDGLHAVAIRFIDKEPEEPDGGDE